MNLQLYTRMCRGCAAKCAAIIWREPKNLLSLQRVNIISMAKTNYFLSKKKNSQGEQRVVIRLTVNRSFKPTFQTDFFINPKYVKGDVEGRKPVEISKPKRTVSNAVAYDKVSELEVKLDTMALRYRSIAEALEGTDIEADRQTIELLYEKLSSVEPGNIKAKTVEAVLAEQSGETELAEVSAPDEDDPTTWPDDYLKCFEFKYLPEQERTLSKGRLKHIKVTLRIMQRYQAWKRLTDTPDFSMNVHSFGSKILADVTDYIYKEKQLSEEYPELFATILEQYPAERGDKHKNPTLRERGDNRVVGILKILRAFHNWLNKRGKTTAQPFLNFEMPKERYADPYYLTLEERKKIETHDFSATPELGVQRDIFIFHCLVGCRVGDLVRLTPANVQDRGLYYVPTKTIHTSAQTVKVPLVDTACALLKKYEGVDTKGRLFPFLCPDKYNDYIKKIVRACGIDRKVTVFNSVTGEEEHRPICDLASSHMARRTFVGTLYQVAQDPELIGSMSGHSKGSRAFARYRKIDNETKKKVLDQID